MKPHRLEIRFADIDVAGHVNNAIYLTYFEQGRMQYFKQVIGEEWDWKKYGIILARNEIDYLKPILLNDEVYITASIGEVGNKSFKMHMHIFKKEENQTIDCARGIVTVVCFDYEKQQTIPVPEVWLKAAGISK
jgi:acyl-CoA thioester hydrolase